MKNSNHLLFILLHRYFLLAPPLYFADVGVEGRGGVILKGYSPDFS